MSISRRSSEAYLEPCHPEVFLGKDDLKICSKFTGEHPCQSAIAIKLFCSFIGITLRRGCSPVNLLHYFRTPFLKNTSGGLLLFVPFKTRFACGILLKQPKYFEVRLYILNPPA